MFLMSEMENTIVVTENTIQDKLEWHKPIILELSVSFTFNETPTCETQPVPKATSGSETLGETNITCAPLS